MSKIISDTIQGRSKDPNVNAGLTVAGVTTATGVVNASSDVRISGNINAGIATFTSDVRISGNINAGIATFTSIAGDGSALTGVANTDFIVSVAQTTSRLTVNSDANIVGVSTFTGTTTLGQVTLGIGKSINFANTQKAFFQEHSVGVGTTTTTGRDAGIGTAPGTMIFNSTTKFLELYHGTGWVQVAGTKISNATGGSKDTSSRSGFAVHTFTGSGSFQVTDGTGNVEYVIYGGGGGGAGHAGGGGGGAGGVRSGTISALEPGTYTVTVGGGGEGKGDPQPSTGDGGQNSSVAFPSPHGGTIIAYGGGGGGDGSLGGSGGSGGGGPGTNPQDGGYGFNPGTPSPLLTPALQPLHPYPITQGYNGARRQASPNMVGGGGGGTGGGSSPTNAIDAVSADGGPGTTFGITGSSVTKGGGGGAGAHAPGESGGEGGPGGGADGSPQGPNTAAPSAAVNTASGGGGGGGTQGSNPSTGGDGGSGIIYLAYEV